MTIFENEFLGIAKTDTELVAVFRDSGGNPTATASRDTLVFLYIIRACRTTGQETADHFKPLLMLDAAQRAIMQGTLQPRQIAFAPGYEMSTGGVDHYAALKRDVRTHRISPLYSRPLFVNTIENKARMKALMTSLSEEAQRQGPVDIILYCPPQTSQPIEARRRTVPSWVPNWVPSWAARLLRPGN